MICELKAKVQLNLRTPFFPDNVRDVSGTKYLCFIHTFCTPSDDQGDPFDEPLKFRSDNIAVFYSLPFFNNVVSIF